MKNRAFDYDLERYPNWIDPKDVTPYPRNAKLHPPEQIATVVNSITRFGWQQDTVITADNVLVVGHGRRLAALEIGCKMPYHRVGKNADELTDAEIDALRLADNKVAESGWDFTELEAQLAELELDFDMSDFGFDDMQGEASDTDPAVSEKREGILQRRFIVPPFSVIDAKQGYYNERKRAWREKINDYGEARPNAKIIQQTMNKSFADASLLDPVMSEAMLRWYTPNECSKCYDVFAGDTVFGYVAATLGHVFTGIELREEQAAYNNAAVSAVNDTCYYYCDDGRNVLKHIPADSQDLLFSCPPYYDLEVYSDKENDASNQPTFEAFYAIIDEAFTQAIKCLKNNRFAVIVVANMRDKRTGYYYDFTGAIKGTFARNGMGLYNDMVLADPIGTAAQRAVGYMRNRKVVKVHQNILVFYKGDPKKIAGLFPDITEDIGKIEGVYAGEDS